MGEENNNGGKYVSLADAKKHLNVDPDFTDDDGYISGLCQMAEESIQLEIGQDLEDLEDENEKIPKRLRQGILLFIGHLYMIREPVIIGTSVVKVPYGLDYLISPFKSWTIS